MTESPAEIARRYGLTTQAVADALSKERSNVHQRAARDPIEYELICAGVRAGKIETDNDRLTEANRLIWQVIRGGA